MTFKDLKRFVEQHNGDNNNNNNNSNNVNNNNPENIQLRLRSEAFKILNGLPFWIEDKQAHKQRDRETKGRCCWNHVIGLPQKDGRELPIFDYETLVCDALTNHKNVFIKKSRGLGITELILRWMCHLATYDNRYSGCRFNIICGPRIQIAESYIARIYDIFTRKLNISLPKSGPMITVNNVLIQAFPSHTASSARGYTDVKFFFVDEAAFFIPSMQEEVSAVVEGYRGKSNPTIIFVSTPYKVNDLFYTMDKAQNTRFYKIDLPHEVGLGKIYDPEELEKEKQQPYFKREYCLMYNVGSGNIFTEQSLQVCEQLGIKYRGIPHSNSTIKSMGIDEGFGSSATAFVIVELIDNIIRVIHSEQLKRSSNQEMIQRALQLMLQYNILDNQNSRVWIDASQPGLIKSLKLNIAGETVDYERIIQRARQNGHDIDNQLYLYMRVVPVNFNTQGKIMLGNLKKYIDMGKVAIDPEAHSELLGDLRIAEADENLLLKKDQANTQDLLDAFRLAIKFLK
ncbi:MAG TPA: terminase family protein [Nitrososphaeraceae archaeon]|nr:terminase family protein [Nitrososphaeraceae archaeon]